MCISPKYITKTLRNGVRRVYRCRCGKCQQCLRDIKRDWCFRLEQELKVTNCGVFVTLTYADWSLPMSDSGRPTLDYNDVQKFMKRLRINYQRKSQDDNKLRFFCCGEYGKRKGRPHYHLIIYGLPKEYQYLIDECWQFGFTYLGYSMSGKCINYVSKYVQKQGAIKYLDKLKGSDVWCDKLGVSRPFRHMSLGIGKNYLNDATIKYHLGISTLDSLKSIPIFINKKLYFSTPRLSVYGFKNMSGKVIEYPLPRYFRKKIFENNVGNVYDYQFSQHSDFQTYFYEKYTRRPTIESLNLDYHYEIVADMLRTIDNDLYSYNQNVSSRLATELCRSMLTPEDYCDKTQDELLHPVLNLNF